MEALSELEKLAQEGKIDLFYGDESAISSEGYVPYGWQFREENVAISVEKGYKINCFALLSRHNECHWAVSEKNIDSRFIIEQVEALSMNLYQNTVLVLDNARIHQSTLMQERRLCWEKRGLFLFFLPSYSPHLNLAETLWRKMKKEQIDPEDYMEKDRLFYAVNRCLAQIGKEWRINFSTF